MSESVQRMFGSIASRYDLANDVLSLGIHRSWRKRAVARLNLASGSHSISHPATSHPKLILDLCTGTGDFAFEILAQARGMAKVVAIDFVPEMLSIAAQKAVGNTNEKTRDNLLFIQGDAMRISLKDASLDGATIAFGIRNVDNPLDCLRELKKALKAGGRLVILEFGQPTNPLFGAFYWAYARYLLPLIGASITGNRAAYEYLPRTSKAFPCGEDFLALLRKAEFNETKSEALFGGIAYLYSATA